MPNPDPRRPLPRALAALSVLILAACARAPSPPATPPKPVGTATAVLGGGALPITAHGQIAYRDEMRLSFKLAGIIERIDADAGDSVRAGQPLAHLALTEADAQLAQARANDDRAARELARGERLFHDEAISLSQVEDLRTARALAAAELRAVQFNTGHALITAPSDGVVLRRLAQTHELVAAGAPVLLFGSAGRGLVVRFALSDRDILAVAPGAPLTLSVDALPGRTLAATVTERSRSANELGLYPVEATIAAADAAHLDSGMVARVLLPVRATNSLVHVPIAAVLEGDGRRASVLVLRGGHAERRAVDVAFIDADSVALTAGLAAGETVITDGAAWVDDHEAVTVTPAR